LIKADCINVVEKQSFTILPTGSIQLESTPVPQIPGASNFSSTATILIENNIAQHLSSSFNSDSNGNGGSASSCSITATVLVTASGPWGLTSTIESFMATAAQESLQQFLGFCCQEINDLVRAGALQAALARVPRLEELTSMQLPREIPPPPQLLLAPLSSRQPREEEDAGESILDTTTAAEFYDAEEAATAMLDLAGLQPEEVNEVLSLSLRYLFKSIDENTAILKSIDARLERLEEQQKENYSSSTWRGTFEKVWARMPSAEVLNSRQVVLLTGVAVTSAAITSLFYRTKTRTLNMY
jgi:hypothetical protein